MWAREYQGNVVLLEGKRKFGLTHTHRDRNTHNFEVFYMNISILHYFILNLHTFIITLQNNRLHTKYWFRKYMHVHTVLYIIPAFSNFSGLVSLYKKSSVRLFFYTFWTYDVPNLISSITFESQILGKEAEISLFSRGVWKYLSSDKLCTDTVNISHLGGHKRKKNIFLSRGGSLFK